ncbi:unnamed protein product [Meganyctiphanes norvegica]|uniref:Uncharacterized protein n=1 Tax=Meganyctiphanes norvegica TaxID=48144 RepID=A0AAV2QMF3_MEGNR
MSDINEYSLSLTASYFSQLILGATSLNSSSTMGSLSRPSLITTGETKMTWNSNKRRNSWPNVQQISRQRQLNKWTLSQVSPGDGDNNRCCIRFFMRCCMRVKDFFINLKQITKDKTQDIRDKITSNLKVVEEKISPLVHFLPVLISITTLVLTIADVTTDALSAHRICTTSSCRCFFNAGTCLAPGVEEDDICIDAFINGTYVYDYCGGSSINITEEACRNKDPWLVPNTCQCYWTDDSEKEDLGWCQATTGRCDGMVINGVNIQKYCNNGHSKGDCENFTWSHPDPTIRHPYWCYWSIGFILGPSILINLILLISSLYKFNYRRYLIIAGLSSIANFHWIFASIVITVMAIIQILPYICILLKIVTTWKIYRKSISEGEDYNNIKSITMIIIVILSCTEDLPQLTLQTMVYVRAVASFDRDGIVDEMSWLTVASVVISCLSLSKNYTEYSKSLSSSCSTSFLLIFSTTCIASGGRVLICCLFVYSKTWRIFLPVSGNFVIQIIFALSLLCFGLCRKSIGQKCLCLKKDVDSSEFQLVDMYRNPEQHSCDFTVIDIPKRSACENCKYQKLFNAAYTLGRGLRSLLFSVTTDGHSHLGLLSSACYVIWALYIKLNSLFVKYADYEDITTTALTLAMLSYTLNAIVVVINGQHRVISLFVSVLFIVLILILITYQYMVSKLVGDAIDILIPIITVAGLITMINIIALVLVIVKKKKTVQGKKKFKECFKQKTLHFNVSNEVTSKCHTI